MRIYMHVYTCICLHAHVYMSIYTCLCMYTHTYVSIHISVFVCESTAAPYDCEKHGFCAHLARDKDFKHKVWAESVAFLRESCGLE